MFKFFSFRKWAHVKTYTITSGYTYRIHLFESSKGRRRIECISDGKVIKADNVYVVRNSDIRINYISLVSRT